MLETGAIQLLVTPVIGQIVHQSTHQPLKALMVSDATKQHVPLLANLATLQLAEDEQNSERTKKLENGFGKINLEIAKLVKSKPQ